MGGGQKNGRDSIVLPNFFLKLVISLLFLHFFDFFKYTCETFLKGLLLTQVSLGYDVKQTKKWEIFNFDQGTTDLSSMSRLAGITPVVVLLEINHHFKRQQYMLMFNIYFPFFFNFYFSLKIANKSKSKNIFDILQK